MALPIHPDTISAVGNSTYPQAMALIKSVVSNACQVVLGIIEDGHHALIVPQRYPVALRNAIWRAWEDDRLRRRVAEEDRKYPLSVGREVHPRENIFTEVVAFLVGAGRLRRGDVNSSARPPDPEPS